MTKLQIVLLLLGSLATVALGDAPNIPERYMYHAKVVSIYDGDTITVQIDHGFNISSVQDLRLNGIDTPERRGPQKEMGLEARTRLLEFIPIGSDIVVKTVKDRTGKFGRYRAILFAEYDDENEWYNVNERLVNEGYADRYNGQGQRRDWTTVEDYPLPISLRGLRP